ncbi:MAG: sulfite exporter TauE/SafE family protein [Sphingopyxis sp.]|nr:sulfite exporter TauE/SafE family protein [Sphingopyxis sp.]
MAGPEAAHGVTASSTRGIAPERKAEDMQAGLLIVAAAFLTSILSGIFGMAGGLVFMGILAWILPVATALALHGVIQFASNLWRVILHRAHVAWRVLLWFGIGAAASTGFFSLVLFTPTKFWVFLALGLMPILVWLPQKWLALDADNRWHALCGGFVSTGLALVSGVSGPVTDLLFIHTRLNRHQVVATKALMQAIGHASKILVYGTVLFSTSAREIIPQPVTAIAVFASMAGIMVGGYILDRISDAHFRASRRWIVTIIGATFLFQAVRIATG